MRFEVGQLLVSVQPQFLLSVLAVHFFAGVCLSHCSVNRFEKFRRAIFAVTH